MIFSSKSIEVYNRRAVCLSFAFLFLVFFASLVNVVGFYLISSYIFLLLSILGIGIFLFPIYFDTNYLSLSDIFSAALVVAYGVGSFNTIVSYDFDVDYLARLNSIDLFNLNLAFGASFSLCGMLKFFGKFEKYRFKDFISVEIKDTWAALLIIWMFLFLTLLAFKSGALQYGSIVTEDGATNASIFGSLISGFLAPMAILSFLFFLKNSSPKRFLFLIATIIIILFNATQGRRIVIYGILIVVMIYRSKVPDKPIKRRGTGFVIPILFLIFGLILSRFYYAMRLAVWDGASSDISSIILDAISLFFESSGSGLNDSLSENVKDRTFIIGYLGLIIKLTDYSKFMYGEVAFFDLQLATPNVFFGDKSKIINIGAEEDFYHPHLGLPIWDAANSLLTAGFVDFGYFGIGFYALILIFVYYMISIFLNMFKLYFINALAYVLIIFSLWNVESTLSTYIVVIRNIGIIYLFGIFAKYLKLWFFSRRN